MYDFTNIRDLMAFAHKQYPDQIAFNIRNKEGYFTIKYDEFLHELFSAASALASEDILGKHIAVVGENSYNWVVAAFAVVCAGGVVVPIDKELQTDEIVGIAKSGDAISLFYSSAYAKAASLAKEQLGIKIILMDKDGDKHCDDTLKNHIERGSKNREGYYQNIFDLNINPDERCAIVFTSGTTGISKGVMLSHTNFISNIHSGLGIVRFSENRFSLLPMHHTYEFNLGLLYSIVLGRTQSINNSIKYISQNLKMFAPTDLVLVPLIVETLYKSIWDTIRKNGKEKSVKKLMKFSNFLRSMGIDCRRFFFRKILDALGGKIIRIFSGGAHLDIETARGFETFGIDINIGYGITECSPLISGNCEHILDKMGSCGFVAPGVEIKLDEPNEEGEGEIMVKGGNVMLGYYKNPVATEAVLQDGWFRTGDIGKYDSDGFLWITGRIKNIIVLKNGKNIYPEEIEGYIMQIPYVKEVVVYGAGGGTGEDVSLSVEVFPNFDRLAEDNITDFKTLITNEINKINSNLAYYKRLSYIGYRDEEFLKTTTRKIKRDSINGKQ